MEFVFHRCLGKVLRKPEQHMTCKSAAHKYGVQPFDKYIEARENPVAALLAVSEGWHNYHHVFPWTTPPVNWATPLT
ncbi:hypothetical protein AVEN_59179-1 [Araneus ventricosus]|uniref:Stearoyl-CoA desaturase 5 n=1 Tax=Araneus ventricosus TaxID=182803 RepID=A0A4Y2V142_ARAVE|nr:hypothetical protein AVEN_59179-1 [Araneus ventricosus]